MPDFTHLAAVLAFALVTGTLLWIVTGCLVSAARGHR